MTKHTPPTPEYEAALREVVEIIRNSDAYKRVQAAREARKQSKPTKAA